MWTWEQWENLFDFGFQYLIFVYSPKTFIYTYKYIYVLIRRIMKHWKAHVILIFNIADDVDQVEQEACLIFISSTYILSMRTEISGEPHVSFWYSVSSCFCPLLFQFVKEEHGQCHVSIG